VRHFVTVTKTTGNAPGFRLIFTRQQKTQRVRLGLLWWAFDSWVNLGCFAGVEPVVVSGTLNAIGAFYAAVWPMLTHGGLACQVVTAHTVMLAHMAS